MNAITLIAPVAIVLVAENLGHVKAVAAMTGQNLDRYLGRAFLGDGIATMVAGAGGGTGVTTYAENIGVMAVTKIYSTLVFVIAACVAIVLGFSPKFGALIGTIPGPVLGGLSLVLFGLIAATGARIWVQNKVDFSKSRNLITVAIALTMGAGDLTLTFGGFSLGGIGTATFGAIIVYQLLRGRDGPQNRPRTHRAPEEPRPPPDVSPGRVRPRGSTGRRHRAGSGGDRAPPAGRRRRPCPSGRAPCACQPARGRDVRRGSSPTMAIEPGRHAAERPGPGRVPAAACRNTAGDGLPTMRARRRSANSRPATSAPESSVSPRGVSHHGLRCIASSSAPWRTSRKAVSSSANRSSSPDVTDDDRARDGATADEPRRR